MRLTLSVEKPNGVQHLAEMINEFVVEQSEQIIGDGYERFTSYLTALGLFILVCNLMGLIPGLESPTANVVGAAGICDGDVSLLPLPRAARERAATSSSFWGRCGGLRGCCSRSRSSRIWRASSR